jgi:hypothetical protein
MAVVDIDMVDTVVNHRRMSSGRPISGRSRRQRSSAPSTSCSGIMGTGSVGWDIDGDTDTVVWSSDMGKCRCGAGQGSHAEGEEACQLHGE